MDTMKTSSEEEQQSIGQRKERSDWNQQVEQAKADKKAAKGLKKMTFPKKDETKSNQEQGLYEKFHVARTDGSSVPGGKHYGCPYFVLDLAHDKHAPAALKAYADSCEESHPQLAEDIRAMLARESGMVIGKGTPSSHWRVQGNPDPHDDHYNVERSKLSMGWMTDDELANGAFMNYDRRPQPQEIIDGNAFSPIVWMTAVKERIRWLSRSLEAALTRQVQVSGMLTWALKELLSTLPERRDWLNPDAEKIIREVVKDSQNSSSTNAG